MFNIPKLSNFLKGSSVDAATPTPQTIQTTKPHEISTPAVEKSDANPHAPLDSAPHGTDTVVKNSWLSRLKQGLSRTSTQLAVVLGVGAVVDENLYEELETALLQADCGMAATTSLLKALRLEVNRCKADTPDAVRQCLAQVLTTHLQPLQTAWSWRDFSPCVLLIVGVNGAGKTTSIGKLAHWFATDKASVLLAAGDTFRAAAREQLAVWGERNGVSMLQQQGNDPSAVVFDAVTAAKARGVNVLLADTAGRLPTQTHLMEELKKIRRIAGKAMPDAPHGVWLVLDGNTGQNAVAQAKAFHDTVGLTGLIVTKLDGTAKGGMLAALASTCPVPVRFIGVGEGLHDLQPFDAAQFARSLVGVS
jgi:fused signal recognition particle receptor